MIKLQTEKTLLEVRKRKIIKDLQELKAERKRLRLAWRDISEIQEKIITDNYCIQCIEKRLEELRIKIKNFS